MKVALGFIVLSMLAIFHPVTAQAVEEDFTAYAIKRTNCDRRAPLVGVELAKTAEWVGVGPVDSEAYPLDENVAAGKHRYRLPRQPFGSTREWVMVAAFKGDQGLYTAPVMTFKRPTRADCVVEHNPRITTYSSDVNVTCGADFEKMVIARLRVKHSSPGYIVAPGVTELVKKNDTELHSTPEDTSFVGGTGGTRRMVEYYFFTGRRAQFKLDPSENGIWPVVVSSKNVELVAELDAICQYMGT